MSARALWTVALACVLIASAVVAIDVQQQRRDEFTELRRLEHERDALEAEWGRLQLEESTLANHDRIEQIARSRLKLHAPSASEIVVVSP